MYETFDHLKRIHTLYTMTAIFAFVAMIAAVSGIIYYEGNYFENGWHLGLLVYIYGFSNYRASVVRDAIEEIVKQIEDELDDE